MVCELLGAKNQTLLLRLETSPCLLSTGPRSSSATHQWSPSSSHEAAEATVLLLLIAHLGLDKRDEALCSAKAAPHGGRCRTKASALSCVGPPWFLRGQREIVRGRQHGG